MTQASQSIGGVIYSGLIDQRGSSNQNIKGFAAGTTINAFERFKGFMDTADKQGVINSLITGIQDLANESVRGLLLGASSAPQSNSINALIFNPAQDASESIKGFIFAQKITESIKAGINLGQKVQAESFCGFLNSFDPGGVINALIFRPPALSKSFKGFVHGLEDFNENINALVYFPSEESSESIKGFLQGHSILSQKLNGHILGISGSASGAINSFLEAVQGAESETINGLINGISGSDIDNINGFLRALGISDQDIKGFTIGGPSPDDC